MNYSEIMRPPLDIKDDMLLAVKEIARQRNSTAGDVLSMIFPETTLRESLAPKIAASGPYTPEFCNGVPLLPLRPGGPRVTMELVNRLRDEDE